MLTLAANTGLFSSQQMLLMLAVFSSVGLVVAVILLIAKLFGPKPATAAATSETDLQRRRLALEIERMELENMERRQRLTGASATGAAKAA